MLQRSSWFSGPALIQYHFGAETMLIDVHSVWTISRWLTVSLTEQLTNRLTSSVIDQLTDWLTNCLTNWPTTWLTDRMAECLTYWPTLSAWLMAISYVLLLFADCVFHVRPILKTRRSGAKAWPWCLHLWMTRELWGCRTTLKCSARNWNWRRSNTRGRYGWDSSKCRIAWWCMVTTSKADVYIQWMGGWVDG